MENRQPVVHVIDHSQSENHCEEQDLRHCPGNPKLIINEDAQGNRHQTRRQASVDPEPQGRAFSSQSCAPCTSTLACRRICYKNLHPVPQDLIVHHHPGAWSTRHQTISAMGARCGPNECPLGSPPLLQSSYGMRGKGGSPSLEPTLRCRMHFYCD